MCRTAGGGELGDFRASSLGTLVQMVRSGIGVTLLPALASEIEVTQNPGLVLLPFTHPRPYRTIGLAWRPTSARVAEYELLGELIEERAPVS